MLFSALIVLNFNCGTILLFAVDIWTEIKYD
jgi:hypothetical protein